MKMATQMAKKTVTKNFNSKSYWLIKNPAYNIKGTCNYYYIITNFTNIERIDLNV